MLVSFSVENFLSFKDRQTLDMTAVATCKERQLLNVFKANTKPLLKSAVVYGANASGKTNFVSALSFFKYFIVNSSKDSISSEEIHVVPFLLNKKTQELPSKFEIEFIMNETLYRYGFCVTNKLVTQEWLFQNNKSLFLRENSGKDDIIQIKKAWGNAIGLEERTRANALFLTVCAQFAMPQAEAIIKWISNNLVIISGAHPNNLTQYTCSQMSSDDYNEKILHFLRNADMNIVKLTVDQLENNYEQNSTNVEKYDIYSSHNVYDDNGEVVDQEVFPFNLFESLGTQKAFALAGPISNALNKGLVLVVDELDSRLHPIFTRRIVSLFNSCETNPQNAQLIFNTHDTNLLSYKVYNEQTHKEENMLRRDQVYFAEKDFIEATHIYSLIEFKKKKGNKVRNDASFEKDYLSGLYGAIPFIGDLIQASNNGKGK